MRSSGNRAGIVVAALRPYGRRVRRGAGRRRGPSSASRSNGSTAKGYPPALSGSRPRFRAAPALVWGNGVDRRWHDGAQERRPPGSEDSARVGAGHSGGCEDGRRNRQVCWPPAPAAVLAHRDLKPEGIGPVGAPLHPKLDRADRDNLASDSWARMAPTALDRCTRRSESKCWFVRRPLASKTSAASSSIQIDEFGSGI
jgi:hypothetical protein